MAYSDKMPHPCLAYPLMSTRLSVWHIGVASGDAWPVHLPQLEWFLV